MDSRQFRTNFPSEKAFNDLFKNAKFFDFHLNYNRGGEGGTFAGLKLGAHAAHREKPTQGFAGGGPFAGGFFLKTYYDLPTELQLRTVLGADLFPRLQFELVKLLGEHRLKLVLRKSCHPKAPDGFDFHLQFRLLPVSVLRFTCSTPTGLPREDVWALRMTNTYDNLRSINRVVTSFTLAQQAGAESLRAAARFAFSYDLHEQLTYAFDAKFRFPQLTPKMRIAVEGAVAPDLLGRLGFVFDPFEGLNEASLQLRQRPSGIECQLRLRSDARLEAALALPLAAGLALRQTVSLTLADLLRRRGGASWAVGLAAEL